MSATEKSMQVVRENRSSESNFDRLLQELDEAIALAQNENNPALAENLQEVKEKQVAAYQKAKESGGTAWPEFEKFVTQFERLLTSAAKEM